MLTLSLSSLCPPHELCPVSSQLEAGALILELCVSLGGHSSPGLPALLLALFQTHNSFLRCCWTVWGGAVPVPCVPFVSLLCCPGLGGCPRGWEVSLEVSLEVSVSPQSPRVLSGCVPEPTCAFLCAHRSWGHCQHALPHHCGPSAHGIHPSRGDVPPTGVLCPRRRPSPG